MKKRTRQKLIANKEKDRVQLRRERKQKFIEQCYLEGGKPALEAIRKYGQRENGEPIRWDRIFEESILLSADVRIGYFVKTGNAQGGKTLTETLVFIYFVSEGQINCAWIYDTPANLHANMPTQFQRVAEAWIKAKYQEVGLNIDEIKHRNKNKNRRRYTIGRALAIFSHASTSSKDSKGKAEIGSSGASFQSSINWEEERSQWPNGVDFNARLGASDYETKPVRELGTPGAGQGIEKSLTQCEYHFYPHTICPSCQKATCLDPKGALLKQFERKTASGEKVQTYFSLTGRPQPAVMKTDGTLEPAQWWHHDPDNAVETAFVACLHCRQEVPYEALSEGAFLQCLKTGLSVPEFLAALPPGIPEKRIAVAEQISPLTRTRKNIAAEIIAEGLLPSKNPRDWQQQTLGHASEVSKTGLALDILTRSIETAHRPEKYDIVLAGLDQGTGQHWLWITGIVFPPGFEKMDVDDVIAKTLQVVLFAEPIAQVELPALLKQYNVTFGVIDNEPSRDWAESACSNSILEMADQVSQLKQPAIESTVESGSVVHKCWKIRNERFMAAVVDGFYTAWDDGRPLIRLPESWQAYTDPGNKTYASGSPLAQLLGPSFDPIANRWKRGPGNNDDLFYACMFQQAALYLWLKHKRKPKGSGGTVTLPATSKPASRPNRFFSPPSRSAIRF